MLKRTVLLFSLSLLVASAQEPELAQNRLAKEPSPYLLLHADNPVDWYPWGKEAFAKAKKENKPILLSIGYSTCHWCHVMERETFTNKKIAKYLNENFVAIKVDREELPDVDKIYMTMFQVMSGQSGGWPLNVMLTPDLHMFTGATYMAPFGKKGRPGFEGFLKQVKAHYSAHNKKMRQSLAEDYASFQQAIDDASAKKDALKNNVVKSAAEAILKTADLKDGGWGKGPKFPQPSYLKLMLEHAKESKDPKVLKFLNLTATRMAHGGIYDQLVGGFHRYAVDKVWMVPHFEKMLYDQAQLLDFYLEMWQLTKNPEYKRIATEIADYVIRDMQGADGGYYCAQDAQSEGKEGKVYCWTIKELKKILTVEEAAVVISHFSLSDKGNFYDYSDPNALKNLNILSLQAGRKYEQGETKELLKSGLAKMRVVRAGRVQAAVDDKVLASWNGMMIGAMVRASEQLAEEKYLKSAKSAYAHIQSKLWFPKMKKLGHCYRANRVSLTDQPSSYFWMMHAGRSLYQATNEKTYLDFAKQLGDIAHPLFGDLNNGGYYESAKKSDIVVRMKGEFDGAIPTSNSVAALEYYWIGQLTKEEKYTEMARKAMTSQAHVLNVSPQSLAYLLRTVQLLQK